MKIAFSRRLKIVIIALTLLLLIPGSYFGLYMQLGGNFHPITQGEAYRSAQLDRDQLEHYIKKYAIKSILNLRGEKPNAPWYVEEIQVAKKYYVAHYDIHLSASHEPDSMELQKLIDILVHAPRPILIHCKGGSDRSGLVAAMWKVIVDKEPKSQAGKQLSLLYGHFPIGQTSAMDRFFHNWESARQAQ